ncbi:putative alpha/beta-hydrolase [Entomophthora muscae]|nr:putative alpha/beta-hydrolase [Entomophthora muscae]
MGGLDGRYLISNIKNKSYKVLSLTTVATPHRGSPFMDWCKEHLRIAKIFSEQQAPNCSRNQYWFDRLMQHLDTPAYAHLTTDYCINKFNPNTPDDPNVSYFSYNAYVDRMSIANILHFPWTIINERVGRNDGVVPLESGRWGRLVETAQANHFDLVARYRWIVALWKAISRVDSRMASIPSPEQLSSTKPQQFNNVDFYLRMSTFLHSQGF